MMINEIPRRAVVAGLCGIGCAAALTGCAAYGTGTTAPAPAAPAAPAPAAGGAAAALVATADVPVGGGVVFADQDVVVTQPAAGTFKAFSATCTHQGCKVGDVAGGTINCPCHGSTFAIADGSVTGGPAKKALAAKTIKVADGGITLSA
jgi:Rieske Fe-S protein